MKKLPIAGALVLALAACTHQAIRTVTVTPQGDSIITHNGRQPQMAGSLKSGTTIHAVLQEDVSSANHKAGDEVRATLTDQVKDQNGNVLFPAGTEARMRITQLDAPSNNQNNGNVAFAVTSLRMNGRSYEVASSTDASSYKTQNRGALDDKTNIAVGAGAGAVLGGLITGSVKGAVVGGLLGGAGGAAYNTQTGKRDVIVHSGTKLEFKLDQPVVLMVS